MKFAIRREARLKEYVNYIGRVRNYLYMGEPQLLHEGPQAFLAELPDPHARIDPHFHDVDQFQIVVQGTGRLGKERLRPVTFHYADAFSPYGPLVADDAGISFFTLRPWASGGYWGMPGSRDKMPGKAGRNIAGLFDMGGRTLNAGEVVVENLSGPHDDGMAIVGIRLGPHASPSNVSAAGGGRYYLVCSGEVTHDRQALPQQSLIFVESGELLPRFVAGPDGAELLILQFARPSDRPGSRSSQPDARAQPYAMPPDARRDREKPAL